MIRFLLGMATGITILQHRPYRRNLLFGLTLGTLLLVFVGAVFLTRFLAENPIYFVLYWLLCFMLAGLVLLLAVYDMLMIRKEHLKRMDALDQELEEAAEEARLLAEDAKSEDSEKSGEIDLESIRDPEIKRLIEEAQKEDE